VQISQWHPLQPICVSHQTDARKQRQKRRNYILNIGGDTRSEAKASAPGRGVPS
jgi:hypothetical protein